MQATTGENRSRSKRLLTGVGIFVVLIAMITVWYASAWRQTV